MQIILDFFPDAISQFGLIGCGVFSLAVLSALCILPFVLFGPIIGGEE